MHCSQAARRALAQVSAKAVKGALWMEGLIAEICSELAIGCRFGAACWVQLLVMKHHEPPLLVWPQGTRYFGRVARV